MLNISFVARTQMKTYNTFHEMTEEPSVTFFSKSNDLSCMMHIFKMNVLMTQDSRQKYFSEEKQPGDLCPISICFFPLGFYDIAKSCVAGYFKEIIFFCHSKEEN